MNHVLNPNKLTNKLIFTHLTLHSKWKFSCFLIPFGIHSHHSRQTGIPSDWMPGILRIMQPLQRPLTLPMHGKGMPRMRLKTHHTPLLWTNDVQWEVLIWYIWFSIWFTHQLLVFLIEVQNLPSTYLDPRTYPWDVKISLIESKHSFHSRAFHCVRIKTIYLITS